MNRRARDLPVPAAHLNNPLVCPCSPPIRMEWHVARRCLCGMDGRQSTLNVVIAGVNSSTEARRRKNYAPRVPYIAAVVFTSEFASMLRMPLCMQTEEASGAPSPCTPDRKADAQYVEPPLKVVPTEAFQRYQKSAAEAAAHPPEENGQAPAAEVRCGPKHFSCQCSVPAVPAAEDLTGPGIPLQGPVLQTPHPIHLEAGGTSVFWSGREKA